MNSPVHSDASPPLLSIVVPARNEAQSVQGILRALRLTFPDAELVLVDNGSTDGTAQLGMEIEGVKVVAETQAGKGHAMRTGARSARGEYLLFHDADVEYEVRDAVDVVDNTLREGGCGVGVRHVSFDRLRWSSWLANRVIQFMLYCRFGKRVPDVLSGTRCFRRDHFIALDTRANGFGIETEMVVACLKARTPLHYAAVRYTPRTGAQGKKIRAYHLFSLMRLALS
jgi:glycosyltransferase involved in cell wall biosynthesis